MTCFVETKSPEPSDSEDERFLGPAKHPPTQVHTALPALTGSPTEKRLWSGEGSKTGGVVKSLDFEGYSQPHLRIQQSATQRHDESRFH